MTAPFFLGIDIGTQGARVVLMDSQGNEVGNKEEPFLLSIQSREEQSPQEWWHACLRCLTAVVKDVRTKINLGDIKAVSVTSTSGTVIPLDKNFECLHNAIMYSDNRSIKEGLVCREMAMTYNRESYTGFNSSSGLSKMVWFVNNFPVKAASLRKWIHAADYITGKLSGAWAITDYTNALKSGFDLHRYEWPEYLYKKLPLKKEWLPEVVAPGTPIGTLSPRVALKLGLPEGIIVAAGITDGCASQVASGAINAGDWNTTIGTTMVIKGVTNNEVKDKEGRIYNHRHPEGFWMPGGASNIGADWINNGFKDDVTLLDKQAKDLIPGSALAYPLLQKGERFPFIAPDATGFKPGGLPRVQLFVANMEGVAYVERYAYELLEKLSGEKVKAVYTAGGGSNSETWLIIRCNVLNRPIYKMKYVTGAVGAAILGASKTFFTSLTLATRAMTQVEKEILPQKDLTENYTANYHRFLLLLQEKGYLKSELYA
ncbi:MAG: FGGY-family carbohydrate kinase [Chitinophagaceae bacterium]